MPAPNLSRDEAAWAHRVSNMQPPKDGTFLDYACHLSWLYGQAGMNPNGRYAYDTGRNGFHDNELVSTMLEIASRDLASEFAEHWTDLRRGVPDLPERPSVYLTFAPSHFGRTALEAYLVLPPTYQHRHGGRIGIIDGVQHALWPIERYRNSVVTWKASYLGVSEHPDPVVAAMDNTTVCLVHAVQEQIIAHCARMGSVHVPYKAHLAWSSDYPHRLLAFSYLDAAAVPGWLAKHAPPPPPASPRAAMTPSRPNRVAPGSIDNSLMQIGDPVDFIARVRAAFPKRRSRSLESPHLLRLNSTELAKIGMTATALAEAIFMLRRKRPDLFDDWT